MITDRSSDFACFDEILSVRTTSEVHVGPKNTNVGSRADMRVAGLVRFPGSTSTDFHSLANLIRIPNANCMSGIGGIVDVPNSQRECPEASNLKRRREVASWRTPAGGFHCPCIPNQSQLLMMHLRRKVCVLTADHVRFLRIALIGKGHSERPDVRGASLWDRALVGVASPSLRFACLGHSVTLPRAG